MKNTVENKAIFFAQHLIDGNDFILINECYYDGIGVKEAGFKYKYSYPETISMFMYGDHKKPLNYLIKNSAVLLRPLSSITDDEAIELVRIAMYHPNVEDFNPAECASGDGDYNLDGSFWLEANCRCWDGTLSASPSLVFTLIDDNDKEEVVYNQLACTDYLRSKGFALPFNNLSVEQQIEYGWIKLTD